MALLSIEEEMARAYLRYPFSNAFEGLSWMGLWCDDCVHYDECPLLMVAFLNRTPAAWEDVQPGALNRYHCHEFTRTVVEDQ